MALLEADVALPVVRDFVARVRESALGQEVAGSLTPGQAAVGVVLPRARQADGRAQRRAQSRRAAARGHPDGGAAGLGQDDHRGKLARWLKLEHKKKVLLASCDVYRPAAIEQLRRSRSRSEADFFPSAIGEKPVDIARRALEHARTHYTDVLIVDTAGRLAIDEQMMREIAELHAALKPVETLFVVDSMQGQDAVNVAKAFGDALPLTGVMLTKLDGDARGGAALSVRHVTGKPIKFAGVGEKLTGLEAFHPDRMASRILGMGDILSLVEEAHKQVDLEEAKRVAEKLKKGKGFDLEDFKQQIQQMKKMGGIASLVDKLPAQLVGQLTPAQLQDDKQFRRIEGIINSMTPQERAQPGAFIKASRKRRIAAGAGVSVQEVNRLLNQFEQMQKMMKMMKGGNLQRMMRGMKGMFPGMR